MLKMAPSETLAAALRARYETKVLPNLTSGELERARLETLDILTLMQREGLGFVMGLHCGLNAYTALRNLSEELMYGHPSPKTVLEATAFLRQTKLPPRPFVLEDFLSSIPVTAVPKRAAAEEPVEELVYH